MHAKAPGSIVWDAGEVEDINLIQVCLILHKTPAEVEAMNPRHVALVLEISKANSEIEAERAAKKAARAKRKRK
jgi:hypothetical protein